MERDREKENEKRWRKDERVRNKKRREGKEK